MRHRPLIEKILARSKKRFGVRVYEFAIVSNHIHLVVNGFSRTGLQNFFRVVAGHIAQEILRLFPISKSERAQAGGAPQTKENKFWQSRIYSRVVTWGREYVTVKKYVVQNHMETLALIPYRERKGLLREA